MEKGPDLEQRSCPSQEDGVPCRRCHPCATVSGWGGAGAFSDGKLTLSPEVGGMLDEFVDRGFLQDLIDYVDRVYLYFGAPPEVYGGDGAGALDEIQRRALAADLKLVPAPIRHLGTGRTREVLRRMQRALLDKGVAIRTRTPAEAILVSEDRVEGVVTAGGEVLRADYVVVAPGREGSAWLTEEARRLGLGTAVNPVDIGVRVEVPATVMEHLTRATYEAKLVFYSPTFDDKVRTFCMNPYGEVVKENNEGVVTVNGHSYSDRRTANTNFALLVSKTFTEPFRDPIAYGKYVASLANLLGGGVLVQRLGDLMAGRRSTWERLEKGLVAPTLRDATPGDLSLVFPYRHLTSLMEMLRALDKIAPGVASRHTLLYGVEVKFYSSRLRLKPSLETEIENLFAAGDGAGITRGLAQASVSGVLAARSIMDKMGIREKRMPVWEQ
jgi:uncharacterized FAD-dependent dehydrogenase